MIDFEAVPRAYHSPPPVDDHVPTIEERSAAFERQRVQQARESGIDPRAEGMGEGGSLIGGHGKRPTRFEGGRRAEDWCVWPQCPSRGSPTPTRTDETPAPRRTATLTFSPPTTSPGHDPRPDGRTLHRLLGAEQLNAREAHLIEQFLARLRMIEMAGLLSRAGLTVYEIARAMHISASKTPAKTHWVNQFAARPVETPT